MRRISKPSDDDACLPEPEIYEQESKYWPWGHLVDHVVAWLVENAPVRGVILDYMCGTGYLLNRVSRQRRDLDLYGCSLKESFIAYANRHHPHLRVFVGDALRFSPPQRPNIAVCTGGLHHLSPDRQPDFIEKIASDLMPNGYLLLGEPAVREHADEISRSIAALELGSALIAHSLTTGAPRSVTEAAIQVLYNDIFWDGEYKRSRQQIIAMLAPHFDVIDCKQNLACAHRSIWRIYIFCIAQKHEL